MCVCVCTHVAYDFCYHFSRLILLKFLQPMPRILELLLYTDVRAWCNVFIPAWCWCKTLLLVGKCSTDHDCPSGVLCATLTWDTKMANNEWTKNACSCHPSVFERAKSRCKQWDGRNRTESTEPRVAIPLVHAQTTVSFETFCHYFIIVNSTHPSKVLLVHEPSILTVPGLIAVFLAFILVDRLGRRVLLLTSSALITLSLTGLAVFYKIKLIAVRMRIAYQMVIVHVTHS